MWHNVIHSNRLKGFASNSSRSSAGNPTVDPVCPPIGAPRLRSVAEASCYLRWRTPSRDQPLLLSRLLSSPQHYSIYLSFCDTFILPQPHKVSPINWLAHPYHILSFRNLTQTSTPTSTVTFSAPPHPILSYPILPILSNATPPFLIFRPSSRWMAVLSPDEFLGIDISQRSANRMCCVVLCCVVLCCVALWCDVV